MAPQTIRRDHDDIKNLLLLIASSQVHTEAMTYNLLHRRPCEILTDLEENNDFHIVDQNVNHLIDLTKELKGEVLLNAPLEQKVEAEKENKK